MSVNPVGKSMNLHKKRRSKTGCETCRSKHVRCDEKQPNCTRCSRLSLICSWSKGRTPLRLQRRGYGPVKSRHGFQPKEILPNMPSTIGETDLLPVIGTATSHGDSQTGDGLGAPLPSASQVQHTPQELLNLPLEVSTMSLSPPMDSPLYCSFQAGDNPERCGPGAWWPGWDIDNETLPFDFLPSPSNSAIEMYTKGPVSCLNIENLKRIFPSSGSDNLQSARKMPGLLQQPSASLSDHHVALPNSLLLTAPEHEALRHYQTTYSLYRTTKDPHWSTHKVLLSLGSYNPMIMHFLLAVSIDDYSLRKGHRSSSQEAESHFQEGARLLIEMMKRGAEEDHVSTMAAYFFIYLYMSKRKSTAPYRLNQLSLTVLDYVERHELNHRCVNFSDSSTTLVTNSTKTDNSLLARLIMWTYDEDVKCSFQSTGGHLARHLTQHSARTKDVYEASRNALATHWGAEYPNSQQLDDDLNSTVLEFLWALMPLWQDINDLPHEQDFNSLELRSRIEQTFFYLEQKYSAVFRLSADAGTKPRPRVLVNADFDVVLFSALQIYYFRSTLSDLSIETPSHVQSALKTLLTIIQRTFASRGTELHDRLQWPLFLAGIETDDVIYKDWIFSRLTSERVATALQRTVDAQALSGKRYRMAEIRQMLYDTDDLSLPGGSTGFLSAIQDM